MKLLFCTTSSLKFRRGVSIASSLDYELTQQPQEVDEIQSEDPLRIITEKAKSAYARLGKPLVVSDDSWRIPALNDFPGAYMKSMNHWLKPKDWLALMSGQTDRRIFLDTYLAYIDSKGIKIFSDSNEFILLDRASETEGISVLRVTAPAESDTPLVDLWSGDEAIDAVNQTAWQDLLTWHKENKK